MNLSAGNNFSNLMKSYNTVHASPLYRENERIQERENLLTGMGE